MRGRNSPDDYFSHLGSERVTGERSKAPLKTHSPLLLLKRFRSGWDTVTKKSSVAG